MALGDCQQTWLVWKAPLDAMGLSTLQSARSAGRGSAYQTRRIAAMALLAAKCVHGACSTCQHFTRYRPDNPGPEWLPGQMHCIP